MKRSSRGWGARRLSTRRVAGGRNREVVADHQGGKHQGGVNIIKGSGAQSPFGVIMRTTVRKSQAPSRWLQHRGNERRR
jgi:hypothetical protein